LARTCLIVSWYFPPQGGSGVQRMVKWIKYLHRLGWQFEAVVADEQFPTQPADLSLMDELPAGLPVHRLPFQFNPLTRNAPAKKFLLNRVLLRRYLSSWLYIPDNRKSWLPSARHKILGLTQNKSFDCILISAPPFSLALLAAELQALLSIPVILDLRDPWSRHPFKLHPTLWHKHRNRQLELRTIARLPYLISAYQQLLEWYNQEVPVQSRQQRIFIPNGYDEDDFRELQPPVLAVGKLHLALSGMIHSENNHPRPLLRAMSEVRRRFSGQSREIVFHHVGQSAIDWQPLIKRLKLEGQVIRHGYLPHRQALSLLTAMDGLVIIHNERFKDSGWIVGGKLYEYLRLGKPVIALGESRGEVAGILAESGNGRVFSSTGTKQLADFLGQWAAGQTKPAVDKNIEKYSRYNQVLCLNSFLEKVITGHKPG